MNPGGRQAMSVHVARLWPTQCYSGGVLLVIRAVTAEACYWCYDPLQGRLEGEPRGQAGHQRAHGPHSVTGEACYWRYDLLQGRRVTGVTIRYRGGWKVNPEGRQAISVHMARLWPAQRQVLQSAL